VTVTREWFDIPPAEAVDLNLAEHPDISAPLNENGERCPWPWEPQQLVGAPLGQYRCGYCFAMVVAGTRHIDYNGCSPLDDGPCCDLPDAAPCDADDCPGTRLGVGGDPDKET
jgi:hypothetical protein